MFPSLLSRIFVLGILCFSDVMIGVRGFLQRQPSWLNINHTTRLQTLHASSMRVPFPNLDTSFALTESVHARASRCAAFINASPEPFHVVKTCAEKLLSLGFKELREDELWSQHSLKAGDKCYFTRGGSSIVAFTIGGKFRVDASNKGDVAFKILGAHTDSPNLKIKPKSKRSVASGTVQLNIECYGGGLWHTWFDRDLSLAGRVIVRQRNETTGVVSDEHFVTRLVKVAHPVLRIPNLCIHLRSAEERDILKVNKEDHLQPLLCGEVNKQLSSPKKAQTASNDSPNTNDSWREAQEPLLLKLLAHQLQVDEGDIVDFDLSLYDTQPAQQVGLQSEFLCGSRIDNLASCFTILESFADHATEALDGNSPCLENDSDISVMALFDHEEVGSDSQVGAGSTLIQDSIERLTQSLLPHNNAEINKVIARKSFILSVDMAHAVHPNYASKHEKHHSPLLNQGMVIKSNANQRYATSGITGFVARELGRRANVPVQEFSVRNDCPCGSTIGPTLSTNTGIRAVDLGMPQLSMHSIRETMGCVDLSHGYSLFRGFLRDFRAVDKALQV